MKSDPPPSPHARFAFFEQATDLDVIAHRGGNGQWPGDTAFAFTRAIQSGADVIEMDVWGTADDPPVLVLMHSSDISEVTEGSGKLSSLKFEDLRDLNAAYRWSPDGGRTFPFANIEPEPDLKVTKLENVFQRFKDRRMNIEIKQERPSIVKPLLDLIQEFQVPAKNLLIASFHTDVLKEFRKECVQRGLPIATSASTLEWMRFYFGSYLLHLRYNPPVEALQMAERLPVLRLWLLSRGFIQKAHDAGLKVHAWSVDDPVDMQRAIANGIDGIITDFPNRLRAIVDEPD
jgi:glycerophosphoryl diester phosphodiesterase